MVIHSFSQNHPTRHDEICRLVNNGMCQTIEQMLAARLVDIKRRLSLASIERTIDVDDQMLIDCINRLLHASPSIKQLLSGAHLRITKQRYMQVDEFGSINIPASWLP
jgi:hypothetical protein